MIRSFGVFGLVFLIPVASAPPTDDHDSSREMANERTESHCPGADVKAAPLRLVSCQETPNPVPLSGKQIMSR